MWQSGSLTCYTFKMKVKSMTSLEGIRVKCNGLQVKNISGSSCTWEFSNHWVSECVQCIYSPQLVQGICLPDCGCQISPWAERMISRTDSRHRISIIIATDKLNTRALNFPMHTLSVTSCHCEDSIYIAYYVYTNVRLYKLTTPHRVVYHAMMSLWSCVSRWYGMQWCCKWLQMWLACVYWVVFSLHIINVYSWWPFLEVLYLRYISR